jgi:CarD family transcriptional regulator
VDKTYLVLKVAQGDLTVRVPADNAEFVGVREVVGQDGLDPVFEVLRAPYAAEPRNWSRRYTASLQVRRRRHSGGCGRAGSRAGS